MKTKIKRLLSGLLFCSALIGLLPFTGCKTTVSVVPVVTLGTNGILTTNLVDVTNTSLLGLTITPLGVYSSTRSGTATLAKIAMTDTNAVAYMASVYQLIGAFLSTSNYSSAALQQALAGIPGVNNIQNPTASAAISGAITAVNLLLPILEKQANPSPFLLAALQGFHDGIGDAFGWLNAVPTNLPSSQLRLNPMDTYAFFEARSHYQDWRHYAKHPVEVQASSSR